MKFPRHIPFVEHLGFELIEFDAGRARIEIDLREELCNSFMVAHGGVIMSLLDVVMAHAARSPNQPGIAADEARGVVTIEMKTSFMRPGLGRLVAHGQLKHRTASMAFCEGTVFDAGGKLAAHATGTFKYVRALPVTGRKINALNGSD